ncbi:Enoyl-CoA hydratase 2 [Handroanthus impetiginosus]|uniref:Enoyl-CoA hydratase 2 n=1 Tax=Handroanthus impetiginosus TaxID=429701 RepID=A0A2G9HFD6_9LAMI|nr:Enoyl-CoA hydratase 2 [Handroanthus impetiginosus]
MNYAHQSTYSYTERDVALYALGIGACSKDAVDDKELRYVYHQDGQQSLEFLSRFDPRLLLHGQQYIEIYKPLPSSCCLLNKATVAGLQDKGKAAVLEIEILSYEKESGALLCMNRSAIYLRGAGGFSKSSQPYSYTKYSSNHTLAYKVPQSQPYAVYEDCTLPSQLG